MEISMMLIEETSVPDAALPVEAFKAHLRMGTGFGPDAAQDVIMASFLRAAMAAIEARTGKVMIARTFQWSTSFWRDATAQALPVAPVQEILAVTCVARDGEETLVDAERYWLERDQQRPRLRARAVCLPAVPTDGSVQVSFEAGFGAAWGDQPADLQQAVLLLAAHYYEYRDETSLSDGCMPFGVSSLIERYRSMRLGAAQ